ncbi:unnamed protein product [Leptosia nina]|uniref:Uncharacterized protein n=1 Tax=Leptosia nina TaxID=320188 RepID=A0AAV1JLF2_9NEOP
MANIYLKATQFNEVDASEGNNVDNNKKYMIVMLPDDPLRSDDISNENDLEPYKSLTNINRSNNTDMEILGDLKLSERQAQMLRKTWRDSCDRKAAKVCRKACVTTYKIVCSAYLCKKSMKRSFRRECKRNCKARFATGGRSESE